MKEVSFTLDLTPQKSIIFSSKISGIKIGRKEYKALDDGVLIYDKTRELQADEVICQLSTNTSTLIPALRTLDVRYNKYFDQEDVVKSQNNITFYWKPSRLAAFYNRFSTDGIDLEKREPIIKKAVAFLTSTYNQHITQVLTEEFLNDLKKDCEFLGFFEGFPIFDAKYGMPMLKSRIGIHVGIESIMVSTPLDKYADDVKDVADKLATKSGAIPTYKKNRVRFPKTPKLLKTLNIK